jgi:beta-barrel assembly-enhancing protease
MGLPLCVEVCQRTHAVPDKNVEKTIYALFMFFQHHTAMMHWRERPTSRSPSRWRAAAALVLAGALLAPPAQAQLPTLGDTSEMNSSSERKLGERIARELYRDPDYIDDPVLDEYVLEIWKRLLAAARARGELTAELDDRFAWQVLLGKDRIVNAFALPGGWLGLQLGLINVTATRDELASVLAHELSHVTQRHISRLMTQQNRQAPWVIGAMILGALAASKSPDAANALVSGGQALAIQNQLNFSRDMEREADRIGFGVMTQAGFEPQGFVSMFDKLQQAARLNDNGAFPYLRTHPMTTERMADMQSRQQLAGRPAAAETDLVHAMMVGRARALSNPGVDGLRSYVTEADSALIAGAPRARQAGALYAAALASAKLRDGAAAARLAGKLAGLTAGDARASRLAGLLAAEVALQAGNAAPAAALDSASGGRPEVLLSSQARVGSGRAADAAQRLQTWVALHPRDAQAWQLLAAAYTAQGQTMRAIRAEAEVQVAHLDYQAAIDRFKAAQDLARKAGAGGDHIEASIIDTRARQVESLLREQALER